MAKTNLTLLLFIFSIAGCATTAQGKMPNYESRKSYVERRSDLTSEIKQAILKGRVIEGMTKDDVLATWGQPTRIYKYSEHKRPIDAIDPIVNDEHWSYDPPFYSFAPKKFVRFGIDEIVNYVSIDYK